MNDACGIIGATGVYCIIGDPVEHSVSPMLHGCIYAKLGIDAVYLPFRVEKADLKTAVFGLKALGIKGFNVTEPHKAAVMEYLGEISGEARLIGAVNTVKVTNGGLAGFNTDARGFSVSFREDTGRDFTGKHVVIIGAGGGARSVAVTAAAEGAGRITMINRTAGRAGSIVSLLKDRFRCAAECFQPRDTGACEAFKAADIVINATSAGRHPDIQSCPIPDEYEFTAGQVAYDIVYNPAVTRFLKKASDSGCITANGLGMLFYQGVYAFETWTGMNFDNLVLAEIKEKFYKSVPLTEDYGK